MRNKKDIIITVFINGIVFFMVMMTIYGFMGQDNSISFVSVLVAGIVIAMLQGIMTFIVFFKYFATPISNFSCLGFLARDQNEIDYLKNMVKTNGTNIEIINYKGVSYKLMSTPNNVELWLSESSEGNREIITPFYRGNNTNRIEVIDKIDNSEGDCEGLFFALAGSDEDKEGKIPIIFECPDYQNHADTDFRGESDIVLSAFPYSVKIFKNLETFEGAQKLDMNYGAEAIIPIGVSGMDSIPPEAMQELQPAVFFNGIIKSFEIMKNDISGKNFFRMTVKVLSLEICVLIDYRMITKVPKPGQIVSCTAWLSGDWRFHEKN